jgi:hypothetical protein
MESTDTTFADVPDGKFAMSVMSQAGDTKYIWDPANPIEVKAAKEHFKKLKDKGWLVFKLSPYLHRKGKEVKRFHPQGKGYLYVAPAEETASDGEVVSELDPKANHIAVPPVAGG